MRPYADTQYSTDIELTFSLSKVSIHMILARYFLDLPSPWFRQAWRKQVSADTASVMFLCVCVCVCVRVVRIFCPNHSSQRDFRR